MLADGSTAGYDLLAGIPPHRSPDVIATSGLADGTGWIPVDRGTMETGHPGMYAIGDVTTITLANGKPLPRAGVFAHAQGLVVARGIAARFVGQPAPAAFRGDGYCWVEAGGGRAAFAAGAFFAEPDPVLSLRKPGRSWHLGKVLFERAWIGGRRERRLAGAVLHAGSRVLGFRMDA